MKQLFYYLIFILFVAMTGCKEDDEDQCCDPTNPECANYDPCIGQSPVTADFKIFDEIFQIGSEAGNWYEDDVIWDGRVKFSATEKNAYYKWYLGQEVIESFADSNVIKTTFQLDPGVYSAALVVEKNPNLGCFPNDAGRDSTFRTFEVKNVCDLLIMNKFKGVYQDNPEDSLTIEFFPAKLGPGNQGYQHSCYEFLLMAGVNLRGMNDSIWVSGPTGILDKFWRQTSTGSLSPIGQFEVFSDSTCLGEYRIIDQDYIFTGKLITE